MFVMLLYRLRSSKDSRDFLHLRWFLAFTVIPIMLPLLLFFALYSWHNHGFGLHTLSCTFLDCFSSIFLNCFLHKFSLKVPSYLPSLYSLTFLLQFEIRQSRDFLLRFTKTIVIKKKMIYKIETREY